MCVLQEGSNFFVSFLWCCVNLLMRTILLGYLQLGPALSMLLRSLFFGLCPRSEWKVVPFIIFHNFCLLQNAICSTTKCDLFNYIRWQRVRWAPFLVGAIPSKERLQSQPVLGKVFLRSLGFLLLMQITSGSRQRWESLCTRRVVLKCSVRRNGSWMNMGCHLVHWP